MSELNSIHMSVKRDSTNGIVTDAPYYDTKKRSIDSKIVKDLLDKVISDPSLEHAIFYSRKEPDYYGTLKTDQYAILIRDYVNKNLYGYWVCDLDTHEFFFYSQDRFGFHEYVPVNPVRNAVMDLDANGRRWEGTLVNDHPYGYEVKYDENGHVEYEGYIYQNQKIGLCMEYYSDIEKVKSKRVYGGDKLYGRSILYDRNGDVTEDSFWLSGIPLSSSRCLHSHDTEFKRFDIVPSFFAQWLLELKTIMVYSLSQGTTFVNIHKLRKLESIHTIGKTYLYETSLTICSCPLLRSLRLESPMVGRRCFHFEDLPSLEGFVIGDSCFKGCHQLVFNSMRLFSLPCSVSKVEDD